jgi:hypothetical protein
MTVYYMILTKNAAFKKHPERKFKLYKITM